MPNRVKKLDEVLSKYYKHPVKTVVEVFEPPSSVPITSPLHSTINIKAHCKYKVKLRYGDETVDLSLFIKLSPACYMSFQTVYELDIISRFKKEIHAYTVAIPELTKFQATVGSNFTAEESFEKIFPKCFGARLSLRPERVNFPDQDGIIVLDNIQSKEFADINNLAGLEEESARTLVEKLALFHAVPLAFKLKNGEDFLEKILPCLVPTNVSSECFVTVPSEIELIKEVLHKTELMDKHGDLINKALAYSAEFMSVPPPDNSWIGMCHGKFFVYNIMVLQAPDSNVFTDCKIIDLQYLLKRHILTDLALLLTTCSAENLLVNHLEEILQHYHTVFKTSLQRLKVDTTPYEYDNFKKEFKINVRKELLRGLQMIRFMSPQEGQKRLMRSLATWPRYDKDKVMEAIDKKLYVKRMKICMLNLLRAHLLEED